MATIRNAMIMQDRMTPVFNKMLTAMEQTLNVMGGLDKMSGKMMSNPQGLKQAQSAINATRNELLKIQRDIDTLNNKKVSVAVDNARLNAMSNSSLKAGVSPAQMAGTPPASLFVKPNTPQGIFAPLTKEAEEALAAAKKVESSINGIRAPNLASSFTVAGAQGSAAGRAISEAMAKAKQDAAKVDVESLKISKALAGVDYKAIQLGSNNFGQQMKEQLRRVNQEADMLEDNLDDVEQSAKNAGGSMRLLNLTAGISLARQVWDAISGSAAYLDNLSQIQARLNNINDGSQTTEQLQSKIMAAANRSRASYQDMADSVAKLNLLASDAFKSNDEAIAFAEQLNKMFVVSGTSSQEASAAMYQLNQAMASGRLQGDEFRSIIENAPMLANAIAKSMGKSRAELKELSSEGAITADVIKKAMADCADDVNAQFDNMPMTFGQAMNLIQNGAAAKFQAVANAFSGMINSNDLQVITDTIGGALTVAAYVAIGAIKGLSAVLVFLRDNMYWLKPLFIAGAIAIGAYTTALIANKVATFAAAVAAKISTLAKLAHVAATGGEISATLAATAAQQGLNAALWACPITWIVIAVLLLIATLYAAIGAMNHFAGTSISATGVVVGTFFALGASIWNIIAFLWNIFAAIAEFFVNVWNHPVYAVKSMIGNMVKNVLNIFKSFLSGVDDVATGLANAFISAVNMAIEGINWLLEALDSIPFIDVGRVDKLGKMDSIVSTLDDWGAGIDDWVGEAPDDYWKAPTMDMMNVGEAYNNGYSAGQDLENWIGNLGNNLGIDTMADEMKGMASAAGAPNVKGGKLDKIGGEVELSDEDLKMLKDIASTKFVNKFTTLQPNMQVTFGDVHENADIDKIMDAIEDMTEQALAEVILEEEGI